MRRIVVLLGMVAALAVAQLLNAWFLDGASHSLSRNGDTSEVAWLYGLLPLATAAGALVLGRLVLRAPIPDPLVGGIYAVVGLGVALAVPVWLGVPGASDVSPALNGGVSELMRGLMLTVWMAAGIAVIGVAEVVRSIAARRAQDRRARDADEPGPAGLHA